MDAIELLKRMAALRKGSEAYLEFCPDSPRIRAGMRLFEDGQEYELKHGWEEIELEQSVLEPEERILLSMQDAVRSAIRHKGWRE